jgi:glutamyl/glutaminyl-tRNA synthetase
LQNQLFHFNKTRIAPTPSGFLHLGNVLSFVITAAIARKTGAKILLRIDDLDQARVSKHYVQDIFDTLNFLEIPWNEGPQDAAEFESGYSQLCRMEVYQAALRQLAANGKVFACTCSRKQLLKNGTCNCINLHLPLNFENASWRLITGADRELTIKNIEGESTRAMLPAEMRDFIVKKKDGFPAYQLTSVIDDLFYDVDMVVRGEDLWPSTIAQHELALVLEKNHFNNIAFHHHSLLMAPDGGKLSKSAGATSVKYLRENGKKPADIFTLIADLLNIKAKPVSWQELGAMLTP